MARAVWGLVPLLLSAWAVAAQQQQGQWSCRMDPDSKHTGCGLPYELANFQGYYQCDNGVKVGRPSSVEELQAMVAAFPRVKASGVGHSWWREQFCAGNDSNSLNVVTTELQPVLDMINAPVSPKQWVNKTVPASFPIQVDEIAETVTVAAGIPQRILLDYLSEYKFWREPSGWTLPAFSWFIDQTIGGAVATATHGSSMKYGSISSQLRGLKLLLANGTVLEITPKSNPHLFRAAGTSIGRLGVIVELTLKIKRQQAVKRSLQEPSFFDFAQQIQAVSQAYAKAKQANDIDGMKNALFQVDETQAFWFVPTQQIWRTDYDHLDHEPLAVILNIDQTDDPTVQAMSGPDENDVFAQLQKKPVAANARMPLNTRYWSNFYATTGRNYVTPGTYESRKAYISMSEAGTRGHSTFAPYDQYEVAIPMEIAGDCLQEVGSQIYNGSDPLFDGFRTPALVRFVAGEEFYLSPVRGGPRMFVNLEDYISKSSGQPNVAFQRVIALFRERCQARLHWGKAGWMQHAKCFDGAREYGADWCQFGCAVRELDPSGKFRSSWDGWQWGASKAGAALPFASCCGPAGFSAQCQCAARAPCTA